MNNNDENKISIKQIAKLSGVSPATVSRVINNNGRFSEKTRHHVMKVIKENNYGMNYIAKSLRMKKSFTIGVLVPDISNAFFSSIVLRMEKYLYSKGYSVIICNTDRDEQKELAYLRTLEGKMVDGLLVISGDQEFDPSVVQAQTLTVCIDRKPKNADNVVFISSDHYRGGLLATEVLIKKGCEKLGIIISHENLYSSRERLRGFKDALETYGLPYSVNKVIRVEDKETKPEAARLQILKSLRQGDLFDGVFAINDRLAFGAMKACREFGLKVPENVKIIGFDDDLLCTYSSPSLSSVKQDSDQLAKKACDLLLKLIHLEVLTSNERCQIIPINIVLRESV
ncbi:LacI family transcriptional regulator [Sporolactobacillus shoreicorticis]|uniref:LacI family DNA-binding transcriptional regulator n=1 Tax=Sporolactobacillus shoreicorticis TaxID=1923877 RepID=A0ABW5S3F4_9BACL|nr:LacI family DNA-binding transcriptional regulator [Sporolactobacillus shoreicorticis]MCO7124272.1 LacI family transcriptional regulator [Sporolactobacillus shoreicorticis]